MRLSVGRSVAGARPRSMLSCRKSRRCSARCADSSSSKRLSATADSRVVIAASGSALVSSKRRKLVATFDHHDDFVASSDFERRACWSMPTPPMVLTCARTAKVSCRGNPLGVAIAPVPFDCVTGRGFVFARLFGIYRSLKLTLPGRSALKSENDYTVGGGCEDLALEGRATCPECVHRHGGVEIQSATVAGCLAGKFCSIERSPAG